jgi:transcriptional regulator with XRE-family HTH domain
MIQEETQRLLQVLRVAMRILDVSNRDIEKALGLSYGYLSRLFAGSIELKVEHIFQILGVLGLTPAEYFHFAYPRKTSPPSEAAKRMHSILDGFGPITPEEPPPARGLSPDEMEKLVSKALQKLLREPKE